MIINVKYQLVVDAISLEYSEGVGCDPDIQGRVADSPPIKPFHVQPIKGFSLHIVDLQEYEGQHKEGDVDAIDEAEEVGVD